MWKGQHGIFSDVSSANYTIKPKAKKQRQIEKHLSTCD